MDQVHGSEVPHGVVNGEHVGEHNEREKEFGAKLAEAFSKKEGVEYEVHGVLGGLDDSDVAHHESVERHETYISLEDDAVEIEHLIERKLGVNHVEEGKIYPLKQLRGGRWTVAFVSGGKGYLATLKA